MENLKIQKYEKKNILSETTIEIFLKTLSSNL